MNQYRQKWSKKHEISGKILMLMIGTGFHSQELHEYSVFAKKWSFFGIFGHHFDHVAAPVGLLNFHRGLFKYLAKTCKKISVVTFVKREKLDAKDGAILHVFKRQSHDK